MVFSGCVVEFLRVRDARVPLLLGVLDEDVFIWMKPLRLFKVQMKEPCARVTSWTVPVFYFYKKSSGNFTWISADLSIAINNQRLCSSVCVIDVLRVYNTVAFCFSFYFFYFSSGRDVCGLKRDEKDRKRFLRVESVFLIVNAAVKWMNYPGVYRRGNPWSPTPPRTDGVLVRFFFLSAGWWRKRRTCQMSKWTRTGCVINWDRTDREDGEREEHRGVRVKLQEKTKHKQIYL